MSHIERVAVVGAGAVGGYYGSLMEKHRPGTVRFLMRRDFDAVKANGLLRIESVNGDFHLSGVKCFRSTAEIGPVDLAVIAVKATANHDLPALIPPLLRGDHSTAILTLQNGLGNEDFLVEHFPKNPILGGLCFVCINRGEPGVIRHLAHGLVELGGLRSCDTEPAEEAANLFCESGIDCRISPDLNLARWRKLIWNVPFNGLAIAEGGIDVSKIVGDPKRLVRTRRLMDEIISAAAALGYEISDRFAEKNIERTMTMGPYRPSSLVDFLDGKPVEVEAIWGEPLRRARTAGLDVPELGALYEEVSKACG